MKHKLLAHLVRSQICWNERQGILILMKALWELSVFYQ
jgi:hypothetical protein